MTLVPVQQATMRIMYHLSSVEAFNTELNPIPYQQDVNSSAYVQFLSQSFENLKYVR